MTASGLIVATTDADGMDLLAVVTAAATDAAAAGVAACEPTVRAVPLLDDETVVAAADGVAAARGAFAAEGLPGSWAVVPADLVRRPELPVPVALDVDEAALLFDEPAPLEPVSAPAIPSP
jgi:hypothetical protein